MDASSKADYVQHLWERIVRDVGGSDSKLPSYPLLVALCAEPYMGCDEVMASALSWAARFGARVLRRDLSATSQETATQFITRLVRRVAHAEVPVVVGLEALPPSDESHVARQVRALRKMRAAGASVILSLVPEGSQLLEELPECTLVRASQLLVPVFEDAQDPEEREVARLTRGIPSLVRSLDGLVVESAEAPHLSAAYLDEVARLLSGAVRPTLSDEECRARLGMLLLGSGTEDDLERVAGECHADVLESAREGTPLFGITADLSAFCCLGASDDQVLRACMRRLERVCALYPDVPASAMRLLTDRGDYRRAAALGALPECSEVCEVVLDRGAEFLDEGETELVRRTLCSPACPHDDRAALLRTAAEALRGKGTPRGASLTHVRGRGPAYLLVDACSFLDGCVPLLDAAPASSEGLDGALLIHLEVSALMRDGRFSEALRRLAADAPARRASTVSGALLAVDSELARIMAGGAPRADALPEESLRLLCDKRLGGLAGYALVVQVLETALTGGALGDARAQALVSRAERSERALVQAIALTVGAALDLRGGSLTRAHVRSSLASSVAAGIGDDYLARAAGLVRDVSHYLMGGRLETVRADSEDDLGRVCALVYQLLLADDLADEDDALADEVPWDALWLLRLLAPGLGELLGQLGERMPSSWARALGTVSAEPSEEEPDPPVSEAPLRIDLLGGFSLRVRGTLVPDWKIERRNAKSLLEYLVLRHGAETKRYKLVEQVWPDCDYVQGFGRAYQATSALRRAIAEIEPGLDPFVASRTTREISLDMGMVSCDVDEFRHVARAATDSRDDERTLELALRAEGLYEGDLYLPSMDATGFVASLRRELRDLCCDAFVAGSEAATRLGRERTGARLAREAVGMDDLREDAVVALVRALRACGRDAEAEAQGAAFSARVARVSRKRGLRRLVDDAGDAGAEGAGTPSRED